MVQKSPAPVVGKPASATGGVRAAGQTQPFCDGSHQAATSSRWNTRREIRHGLFLRLQAHRQPTLCAMERTPRFDPRGAATQRLVHQTFSTPSFRKPARRETRRAAVTGSVPARTGGARRVFEAVDQYRHGMGYITAVHLAIDQARNRSGSRSSHCSRVSSRMPWRRAWANATRSSVVGIRRRRSGQCGVGWHYRT